MQKLLEVDSGLAMIRKSVTTDQSSAVGNKQFHLSGIRTDKV